MQRNNSTAVFTSENRLRGGISGYQGFQPNPVLSQQNMNYRDGPSPSKHIPGYSGYLPGIKPENVFSKSFGRASSLSLTDKIPRASSIPNVYASQNKLTFVDQMNLHAERKELNPFMKSQSRLMQDKQNLVGGYSQLDNFKITLSYKDAQQEMVSKHPSSRIPTKNNFDATDFQALVQSRDEYEIRRLVNRIFGAVDKDRNGSWNFSEVKEMFHQIGLAQSRVRGSIRPSPQEVENQAFSAFHQMDEDRDGQISKQEFLNHFLQSIRSTNNDYQSYQKQTVKKSYVPLDPQDFRQLMNANDSEVRRLVDKIFASVDQDGNGSWSFDEVREMFSLMSYQALGQERPSLEAINIHSRKTFQMMDEDGDGIITKPEFLNFVFKNRKNLKVNNMQSYFNKVLDPQNFKTLAESTSDNEIRFLVDKIFASADKDDDGSWSFDEVRDMVTLLAQSSLTTGMQSPTPAQIQAQARRSFAQMDDDGDGSISKQEFLKYCLKNRKNFSKKLMKPVKPFDPKDFQALIFSKDDKQIRTLVDKIFSSVDTDGSGQWEFEELKQMLTQLNLQQNLSVGQSRPSDEFLLKSAKQVFNKIDADLDGTITKQEFLNYCLQNRSKAGFFQSTTKATGFDPADFQALANSTDEWDIRRIIDKIFTAMDLDFNGELSFQEVREMLQKLSQYQSQADVHRMSPEQILGAAKRIFSEMDTDSDGVINKQEFTDYCLRNRKNAMQYGNSYNRQSFDGADFKAIVESTNDNQVRYLVDKIFASVDKDNNGSWSFDEVKDMVTMLAKSSLATGMQQPTPAQIQAHARRAFAEMDGDGDGAISKQEFCQYCLKNRKGLINQYNKFKTLTPSKSKPLGFVRPFDPADFRELFNSKDDKQVRALVDKIFTSVDKDGSGEWEFDEVREMFKNLAFAFSTLAGSRPTEENIMNNARKAFTEMDDDSDGVISKLEFLRYVLNKRNLPKSNQMTPIRLNQNQVFRTPTKPKPFDVTAFRQLMEATDPQEIRRMVNKIFASFDVDHNNNWSFDEMTDMLRQFINYQSVSKGQLRPTPEQVMQMARVAFSRMDADGDGSITKEEFLQYVIAKKKENGGSNQMSFRSIQPKSTFNPADFKTLASTQDDRLVNQLVDRIFQNVDADNSGGWSFQEVKDMLKQLTYQQSVLQGISPNQDKLNEMAQNIFQKMDTDGDGIITKDEFRRYCLTNRKNAGQFMMARRGSINPSMSSAFNPADFKDLASSTNDREIRQLVDKIFASVDQNRDGTWSFDEVKEMMGQVGYNYSIAMGQIRPTDEQVAQVARSVFNRMDADGDGRITKDEFLNFALSNKQKGNPFNERPPFNPSDFQALASSDSDREIKYLVDKIFASVDTDGSGTWSFNELRNMFQQMGYHYSVQLGQVRPTDQQIQAYSMNAFNEMDIDGDGCITKQEFLEHTIKNKKQPEYSSNMNFGNYRSPAKKQPKFDAADFKALTTSSDEREIKWLVDKIFSQVDTDGNGTWSFAEVKDMFQHVGYYYNLVNGFQKPTPDQVQATAKKAFATMDLDRDGSISKSEFLDYCLRNKQRR